MIFSDEMGRLTRQISQTYDNRMAAVRDIRIETAHALGEFRVARRSLDAEQNKQLSEYRDAVRREAALFLKETDVAHQAMAADQRKQLSTFVDGLRRETGMFLKEADAAHQAMAADQHQQLSTFVDGLRRDSGMFLKEAAATQQAMAAEQHRRLMAGRARLASDTSAMRLQLRAEQKQARRVWNGFQADIQRRRAVFSSPPRGAAAPRAPHPEGARTDDLMIIRGIGSAMQRRLHEAGIRTYARLARSTPEQLRQMLGDVPRLASVEEWIAEARRLAGIG
ncbi:MAG: DUF4332 domain-containing protein [Chloroflexi bacterium]|nr:DUF4332 domain-containing protein [Chloroflexota bacterium]